MRFMSPYQEQSTVRAVHPDCKLLMPQLTAKSRGKGLQTEAIVNQNTETVKLDGFHKHTPKNTSETLPARRFKNVF